MSSVDTRDQRPIVNLRDEPLGDGRYHARLHLILGDSNMAEYANFVKLGATGLLLDMIEATGRTAGAIGEVIAEVLPRLARREPDGRET